MSRTGFLADVRRLGRQGGAPALRVAKTVLAAVLAYGLAEALHTSNPPILAPLTAILVVQFTLYETVTTGRQRIISVVAGVLLAVAFASFVGLTWWSLGAVIAVSIVAGGLLRLGGQLMEVPISAMLVLAVGGDGRTALGRVAETLIGAAVGVVVDLLIAPPLYIQPASAAISELAERMATYCHDLADAVLGPWSRTEAEGQLTRARRLGEDVAHAERNLARTEESARLNPRGKLARRAEPRLRSTLNALEHAQVGLRNVARALLDRTFYVPEEEADNAYPPGAREALAGTLEAVATALRDAVGVVSAPAASQTGEAVEHSMQELAHRRDVLAARLTHGAQADPAEWTQFGSLLDAVDRLRVELEAALRPPEGPWPGRPLVERQRAALRRAVSAAESGRSRWAPLVRRRHPPS